MSDLSLLQDETIEKHLYGLGDTVRKVLEWESYNYNSISHLDIAQIECIIGISNVNR